MRQTLQLLSILPFLLLFQNCGDISRYTTPLHSELLPADAVKPNVKITDLNCWVEKGQYFITGICSNESAEWQKIWLQAETFDRAGRSVKIKDHTTVVFPTFSGAVPPKGSTSFFMGWPLEDFSADPDSSRITGAGASMVATGPILLVEQISGVKMLAPKKEGEAATEEVAWQINAVLDNPAPLAAAHPCFELLLYGTDKRLWFSTLLNPEDPQTRQLLSMEANGPLQAGEKRRIGVYAFYEYMPQALKDRKIGRVEILAFEAR